MSAGGEVGHGWGKNKRARMMVESRELRVEPTLERDEALARPPWWAAGAASAHRPPQSDASVTDASVSLASKPVASVSDGRGLGRHGRSRDWVTMIPSRQLLASIDGGRGAARQNNPESGWSARAVDFGMSRILRPQAAFTPSNSSPSLGPSPGSSPCISPSSALRGCSGTRGHGETIVRLASRDQS